MDSRLVPFWPLIQEQAAAYALDPYLIGAMVLVESSGNPNAYNKKSMATGLMQVIPRDLANGNPAHWAYVRPTVAELKDPKTNLEWGCKILAWFRDVERGDLKRAVWRYSGGGVWKSFADYEARYWNKVQDFKQKLEGTGNVALTDLLEKRLGAMYADYRAKLPSGYKAMDSRKARYLTIHHATGPRSATVEGIHEFHTKTRGWPGIGYHFVVRLGVLYYVGDVDTMRAHVKDRNDEAIGVCITGDYTTAHPAENDLGVLRVLVAALDAYYGHEKEVTTHGDMLSGYTCPGAAFRTWLKHNNLRTPPPPPVSKDGIDHAKIVYRLEEAARQEHNEGRRAEHDYILASGFYQDEVKKRDAA